MFALKNPTAPATKRQLFRLAQLTGEDIPSNTITMQEASDRIEKLELEALAEQGNDVLFDVGQEAFSEAHVTIVEGDQRSGKTVYVVGKVRDAYDKDCVRIYCNDILHIQVEVKSYDRQYRVAKIKHDGQIKLIQIPTAYTLRSPMLIFANIHLYGIPYVYVPSFRHMLKWLKDGFIFDGILIIDEAHVGLGARSSMTRLGIEMRDQYFQFGKSLLDVYLITHMARLIDWCARTVPTKRVHTTYNPKTYKVEYTMREKGSSMTKELSFYAPQYWMNYNKNEKVTQ